jgi:hypothetical protein
MREDDLGAVKDEENEVVGERINGNILTGSEHVERKARRKHTKS